MVFLSSILTDHPFDDGDGLTLGLVIDMWSQVTLPPTERFVVLRITYGVNGPVGANTKVEYCSTLGVPPVSTIVVSSGFSITPDILAPGELNIVKPAILWRVIQRSMLNCFMKS